MSDENTSDVDDIKIRLSKDDIPDEDDIPVEDETTYKSETGEADVVNDLRNLGRQFGATIRSAWYSEERKEFEQEMREGLTTFTKEVDKAFKEMMASEPAKKVKTEAEDFKAKAESGDLPRKTRSSLSQGLRWFSDELNKLADSFTPAESEAPAQKEPPAEE